MKVKSLKIIRTKGAEQAANGPVWMLQALKTLCLIRFWGCENSLFPLLALWGNKNWPPSMKVKKLEIFGNKSGLRGCKWSRLKGPGTETPLSHPILKLGELPFPNIGPSGVIRIGLPLWKWIIWKSFTTKCAQWAANGPVWMPQALKPLCLIQFWSCGNSFSHISPPTMKVNLQKLACQCRKWQTFQPARVTN